MDAEMSTGLVLTESNHGVDSFVDWRGRPCKAFKHGGMRAALCVLGLLAFDLIAGAAVGNNLITYLTNQMNFSVAKSANTVTNFVGTNYLLSILGGFIADSYLGSFRTIMVFGFVELLGYILLALQAHLPQLKPPPCYNQDRIQCIEAKGFQAFTLYLALYLVALGSGCIKSNTACHGANQFTQPNSEQSKMQSTYFNAGYFTVQIALIIALTVVVWLETHIGMDVGFAVAAAAMLIGLISISSGIFIYRNNPPAGNIFSPMAKVIVAAVRNRKLSCKPETLQAESTHHSSQDIASAASGDLVHTEKFRYLDKAYIRTKDSDDEEETCRRLCTVNQVEEIKILISVIPIFACTVIFNTILAQYQTFTVQQGNAMDRHLTKHFEIPPASLQCIPCLMLIVLIPVYEKVFIPVTRKFTRIESGISALQRVGVGLLIIPFSMVVSALIEKKRRDTAIQFHEEMSIFWLVPQFLIFGVAEMFTSVGLIEFFYKQSLGRIQCFLIAMSYCSYSFGFYLSSLLVSLVNKITSASSGAGWITDNDLNKDKLDLFYWLLAALSFLNFFHYLYWSKCYSYNPSLSPTRTGVNELE